MKEQSASEIYFEKQRAELMVRREVQDRQDRMAQEIADEIDRDILTKVSAMVLPNVNVSDFDFIGGRTWPIPLYIGSPNSHIRKVIGEHIGKFQVENWLKIAKMDFYKKLINRKFEFSYSTGDIKHTIREKASIESIKDTKSWWVLQMGLTLPVPYSHNQLMTIFQGNGNIFYLSGKMDFDILDSGEIHIHKLEFDALNFMDMLGNTEKLLS